MTVKKINSTIEIIRTISDNPKDEYRFSTFLEDKHQFIIPNFQRNYVWIFKKNILTMINDFENIFKYKKEDYFIGNLILTLVGQNPYYSYKLIDGQQRITTILIIKKISEVISFENKYDKNIKSINNNDIFNKYNNKYIYPKIKNSSKILSGLSKEMNFDGIKKWILEDDFLIEIYDCLKEKINDKSFSFWTKELYEKIVFSKIICSNDIAHEVFENINSKSVILNTFELLNNKMYMLKNQFSVDNKDDQDKEVQKIIEKMNKISLFLKKSNQKSDADSMVRIIFMKIKSEYKNEYIEWSNNDKSENFNTITEILNHFNPWEQLNIIKCNTEYIFSKIEIIQKEILNINNLKQARIYTLIKYNPALLILLLSLNNNLDEDGEIFYNFLNKNIQGNSSKSTKNMWVLASEYLTVNMKEIKKENKETYKNKEWKKFSEWNQAGPTWLVKYILLIYEINKNKRNKRKLIVSYNNVELFDFEHIFPKSDKNKNYNEYLKDFDDGRLYKSNPGNLSLLEVSINKSSSDKNYKNSLDDYNKSDLFLKDFLKDYNEFNKEVLLKRSKDIFTEICNSYKHYLKSK